MLENSQAVIFDIQHFSLHDGPGIRTTVFFKGCPLRCIWCSNPESWKPQPEVMVYADRCTKSKRCVESCLRGAINVTCRGVELDRAKCDDCLKCAEVCPSGALSAVGEVMTVEELISNVKRDRLFYQNSDGGVTASGGEPLLQSCFVEQFFEACKDEGISTALDTCGYAPEDKLKQVLKYTDLVLYDIKHMDTNEHRRLTGIGNELILANAQLAASEVRTWLRFSLIPGFNDGEGNLEGTAQFASRIGVEKISLLPYHGWGSSKYECLGMKYPLTHVKVPSDACIRGVKRVLEKCGKDVTIGW